MTTSCPACGATVSGKFCTECGTPLAGAACPSCSAALTPGARFCHRCGISVVALPTSAPAQPSVPAARTTEGFGNALPWAVAAIAILALLALAAGQRFGRTAPVTASGIDASAIGAPRAPDISAMSPMERAERLYDRVMGAAERGRTDSVQFFMPMAIQSYEALAPLTPDLRYDLGRLGEAAGNAALASAQADTILREQPRHLLGLVLAYRAARMRKDSSAASRYLAQLAQAAPSERRKQLPEYLVRQADIDSALATARAR